MERVGPVSFLVSFQTEPVPSKTPAWVTKLVSRWRIVVAVFVTSIFNMSFGAMVGYTAPALPNLNDHRNPFHLTDDEQSWVGSLIVLGFTVAGLVTGTISDLLGRKVAMMACSLFAIVGLTIMAASTNAHFMYAGIFFASFFTMNTVAASILYTAETVPAEIRGTCMAMKFLAYSIGILVSYAVGVVLPWNWLAIFLAATYAVPNIVLVFLPESPRWFILRGNREAAMHGLQWFQSEGAEEEIRAIECSLREMSNKSCWSGWWDLVVVAENRKSLLICTMLFIFQGFSGILPLQMFAVTIFQMSGSTTLDPNLETVISGLCSFVGGVLCPILVDRIGRKTLLLSTSIAMCVAMAITGAFFHVHVTSPDYASQRLSWLPLLGLSLGNCAFSAGLLPLKFILVTEMFPTSTRGNAQAIALVFQGLSSFASIKTFIYLQLAIGTSGALFMYTGVCAVSVLFVSLTVTASKSSAMG